MNKQANELSHVVSVGGTAANHPLLQDQEALVGPATGNEFNTIKAGLIPLACWRLEDVRFDFDSSLVRPESKAELKNLANLVKQHPPSSRQKNRSRQARDVRCPFSATRTRPVMMITTSS